MNRLGQFLESLWHIHRQLAPRKYPPSVKTQALRTRASIDTAIADITELMNMVEHQPRGVIHLDRLLEDETK